MRFAYVFVTYLLMPVYAVYWLARGLGNRSYRDRFGQRFGFGYPRLTGGKTRSLRCSRYLFRPK